MRKIKFTQQTASEALGNIITGFPRLDVRIDSVVIFFIVGLPLIRYRLILILTPSHFDHNFHVDRMCTHFTLI